ncbi:type II toxin-antitoxin system VapC family toxin [Bacillus sp. REN16]|uniref:type II toxin-antitoxin system VapC family toxin n=1 Tax=Bacillus sp. REN16 TaxID=2887296 RepID=UPI001E4661DF|nr:type II toxin-antitoxin system VapC family toxin [Bacillus sp. REN16]MCC3358757.1 type II toxin-antitoxin system VapC family toxin [Bacillus sp. REN16]
MNIKYLEEYCVPGNNYNGDAFFIDTNYLIAFINSKHPFHISTVIHTLFLLQKEARLYVSETVLSEAIDVLARGIYTELKFQEWKDSERHTLWLASNEGTEKQYNDKKNEIRATFIPEIVKNHEDPSLLRYYNSESTRQLSGIIESRLFKLSNTSFAVIRSGMDFAKSVPLQSNDALIAAAAASNSGNILTFDNDFKTVSIKNPVDNSEFEFFTAQIPDNFYKKKNRALNRIEELDQNLKSIIEDAVGGPDAFAAKFMN